MSFTKWKIYHTPYSNGGYDSGDEEEISNYYSPTISLGLGKTRDSFSFNIINFNNNYGYKFKPRDKVTIYRTVNSTTVTTDDVLLVGLVNEIPEKISAGMDELKIKGYNFSESLMSAIVFVDAGLTIPSTIQEGLRTVRNMNTNFAVTWSGTNPTVKENGDPFPTVEDKFFNKPLKKIIEKYSSNAYTTDGTYLWYINNANELIWFKRTDVVGYSFDSRTDNYLELSISKDTSEVVNYVIMHGGLDPMSRPLQVYQSDYASVSQHGFKYKYVTDDNKRLATRNEADIQSIGGEPEDSKLPSSVSTFSYPHTFSWSDTAVTSDRDYITKLRTFIKELLKQDADALMEDRRFGKLKVDITFRAGSKNWGLGDVISCIIPNAEISADTIKAKKLRVQSITYGEFEDKFGLEEDIGTY